MRIIFTLSFILLISTVTYAQGYKQKQFDKLVDNLLSHTVAEVYAKNSPFDSSIVYLDAREFNEFNTSKTKIC